MKPSLISCSRISRVLLAVGLLASASAVAQVSQVSSNSSTHKAALASDTCPVVRQGDIVSLEWNPDFDTSWAVTGVHSITLRFVPLEEDGVHMRPRAAIQLGGRTGQAEITPIGNGFIHAEAQVPRRVQPGVYRMTEASAVAAVPAEYNGKQPHAQHSPVPERYCITIVPNEAAR